ncbi:MAG: tetratricopeptide repeat protein [Cyclobacteriaceae bacterium]|nr:tetratricopeptide repeat protein [Cyclobacteriaceae bacterium]MCH8515229.1 tetratricopeptide repeat protein [Cyclobacteriaceae bacterium]
MQKLYGGNKDMGGRLKLISWAVMFLLLSKSSGSLLFAQSNELDGIDSLKMKLGRNLAVDERVKTLNILSEALLSEARFDEAEIYIRASVELAKGMPDAKPLADALFHLGDLQYYRLRKDSALFYYRKSASIYDRAGIKGLHASTLYYISFIYFERDEYFKALEYAQLSLEEYESIEDILGVARVKSLMCELYNFLGNFDQSIDYCIEALRISEEEDFEEIKAELYHSIASIYFDLKNYNKSEEYFNMAIEIATKVENTHILSSALMSLGEIYIRKEDYAGASRYFESSTKVDQTSIENPEESGYFLFNIGRSLNLKDDTEGAINNLNKALELAKNAGNLDLQSKILLELGRSYYQIGEIQQAIKVLKEALVVAQKIEANPVLESAYKNIAKYYDRIKDHESALIYFKLYMMHNEAMYSKDIAKKASEIEALYELEKKGKQISELNRDRQLQKLRADQREILVYSLAGSFVLVVLILFMIFRSRIIKDRSLTKMRKIQADKTDIEEELKLHKGLVTELAQELDLYKSNLHEKFNVINRLLKNMKPHRVELSHFLPDAFIYEASAPDRVGDQLWFYKNNQRLYFAVIEVRGGSGPIEAGIMQIWFHFTLNQLLKNKKNNSPLRVLKKIATLHKDFIMHGGESFSRIESQVLIGCIKTDLLELNLCTAGITIFKEQNGKITTESSSKGFNTRASHRIIDTNHRLDESPYFYISTRGYMDENGGKYNEPYTEKQLSRLMQSLSNEVVDNKKELISQSMKSWKGIKPIEKDQLVIGFSVPSKFNFTYENMEPSIFLAEEDND